MWLYAQQLGTASNRLDARQSEIFTNFSQKASFKPRESIWCLFRNAKRLKNYFGCVVGGIFLCEHSRGVLQLSNNEDDQRIFFFGWKFLSFFLRQENLASIVWGSLI